MSDDDEYLNDLIDELPGKAVGAATDCPATLDRPWKAVVELLGPFGTGLNNAVCSLGIGLGVDE